MPQVIKPPPFLKGTFLTYERCYFYAEKPPLDLLAPQALDSQDEWIVLAAVLEHAKKGDFTPVDCLKPLLSSENGSPIVGTAAFRLLGHIGTREAICILTSMMTHDVSDFVVDACQGAAYAGFLNLAPLMAEAWARIDWANDRELVALIISEMLGEEESRQIATVDLETSAEELYSLVISRVENLQRQVGSKNAPVWNGKLFGVLSLAKDMYRTLRSGEMNASALYSHFLDLRQKFEASTGIDCSCFYSDGKFQLLSATALLEEFLDSSKATEYVEGERYFFSHRIRG